MATSVVLSSAPKPWVETREIQFAEHKVGSVYCAWQWRPCQSYKLSFSTTQKKRRFLPLASFSSSSSPNTKLYVSVNLVMDRVANRPRGFAFLRYETQEESQKAIKGMHGKFLDGRVIFVEEAKPRSELRQNLKQNPGQY